MWYIWYLDISIYQGTQKKIGSVVGYCTIWHFFKTLTCNSLII